MSDLTASAVADIVIGKLKPLLEDIAKRFPEEGELAAINKGLGATLELEAANAEKLDRIGAAVRNLADNHSTLVDEVRGYHNRTIDQQDRLGARVHALEERVKRMENGETNLAGTGGQ